MTVASHNLLLPVHVPWRRLAFSLDMLDPKLDRKFPLKWRSSLSLFYYQPEVAPDAYPDSILTYLKLVCTITGFQPSAEELGVDVESGEWSHRVWQNFHELLDTYFPCYGALVQVAVHPGLQTHGAAVPLIIDFEPKKREVFEIVSETGEVMSGSMNGLHVTKGRGTLATQETATMGHGWSLATEVSAESQAGGGSFGGQYSIANDRGARSGEQVQNVNMRTIDASRERRESFSHTTQLTQMYHQLDSYHLGTNRALFAVFPRPHIVDTEKSVVNGLRRLEGIQEFFLVVEQPKSLAQLCVEVELETAHLSYRKRTVPTFNFGGVKRGHIKQRIADQWSEDTKRQYSIKVPGGCKVDRDAEGGGFRVDIVEGEDVTEQATHQAWVQDDYTVMLEVNYDPHDGIGDTAFFTADVIAYWVEESEAPSGPKTMTLTEADLFMTGRMLLGCMEIDEATGKWKVVQPERAEPAPNYLSFEAPAPRAHALRSLRRRLDAARRARREAEGLQPPRRLGQGTRPRQPYQPPALSDRGELLPGRGLHAARAHPDA